MLHITRVRHSLNVTSQLYHPSVVSGKRTARTQPKHTTVADSVTRPVPASLKHSARHQKGRPSPTRLCRCLVVSAVSAVVFPPARCVFAVVSVVRPTCLRRRLRHFADALRRFRHPADASAAAEPDPASQRRAGSPAGTPDVLSPGIRPPPAAAEPSWRPPPPRPVLRLRRQRQPTSARSAGSPGR